MNEFNLLSRAERAAYCRVQLRHLDDLEASIRQRAWTPEGEEALRMLHSSRQVLQSALQMVENPTFWQRINLAVNRAAAKGEVQKDLRKRGKVGCSSCHGTGKRPAVAGQYMERCPCGGNEYWYDGDPEIDRAMRAADDLRRKLNRRD
ncbi:hypothetical protein ACSDR0_47260 [Streptosporangium sp. G11]|uniref:hypothetical protein n=1 Tax=Streptosporangium sp. G11 TaxID=3436926 RepID=UPI003EB99139